MIEQKETPPNPRHKPLSPDEIQRKADEQGRFVGDIFTELALGRLKRMPIKNPIVRQALSRTLGVAEDVISWLPEKIWQDIARRQMEERQRKKERENQSIISHERSRDR